MNMDLQTNKQRNLATAYYFLSLACYFILGHRLSGFIFLIASYIHCLAADTRK
jgi:hypothetical protein